MSDKKRGLKKHGLNKKRPPFCMTPNDLINDINITAKAKGIYAFMDSKPEGWNFTIQSMSKQMAEGADAITGALKELKDSGWITYQRYSDGTGQYTLEVAVN